MKVIEILKLNRELLKFCCDAGIRLDDIRYIDLFNDYNRLLADGEKITYIVAALAEKYGVCERTVYDTGTSMGGSANPILQTKWALSLVRTTRTEEQER